MSVRTFYLGLLVAFGLPWVFLVAMPYGKLTASNVTVIDDASDKVYPAAKAGMIEYGHRVYAAEGCYQCHTQMIRTTYAGPDRYRWSEDDASARETRPEDYLGEDYAFLGVQRIGQDLSNVGVLIDSKDKRQWIYEHLYDPRAINGWSNMPAYRHLFEKRRIQGQRSNEALNFNVGEGYEVVPTERARALVTYLLSLKKNDPISAPKEEKPAPKEADKKSDA